MYNFLSILFRHSENGETNNKEHTCLETINYYLDFNMVYFLGSNDGLSVSGSYGLTRK